MHKAPYYIVCLAISLLLVACNQLPEPLKQLLPRKEKTEYLRDYYPSGRLHSISEVSEGKKHGVSKTFYEDGKLQLLSHYALGRYEGEQIRYYPNGKVHTSVNYSQQMRNGLSTSYYENGQPHMVETYVNHKLHGVKKKYYPNGKLMMQNTFINGKPTSNLKEYDPSGHLITNYPELVIRPENSAYLNGHYSVVISFSKKAKACKFFQGDPDEQDCIPDSAYPLFVENQTATISYQVNPGSVIMEKLHIIGSMRTRLGNTRIVTKTYNVAFKY